MVDDGSLERRIARLEDLEAIKQLKARYCEICDDDHDPDRITTIFAIDGVWEGEGIARASGHSEIRALFERFRERISFSQHMVMNPILEVEETRATGIWYFFGPFTMRKRNEARWQSCRYHDDYVKVDGEWKIRHLRVRAPIMSAPYAEGWAG